MREFGLWSGCETLGNGEMHSKCSGVGRILVRGGTPGHQKAITRPPQGVGGGGSPRMVEKFKILKRFKELENESIFQKYHPFSCQKNPFFLRKISKNGTYFTKIS